MKAVTYALILSLIWSPIESSRRYAHAVEATSGIAATTTGENEELSEAQVAGLAHSLDALDVELERNPISIQQFQKLLDLKIPQLFQKVDHRIDSLTHTKAEKKLNLFRNNQSKDIQAIMNSNLSANEKLKALNSEDYQNSLKTSLINAAMNAGGVRAMAKKISDSLKAPYVAYADHASLFFFVLLVALLILITVAGPVAISATILLIALAIPAAIILTLLVVSLGLFGPTASITLSSKKELT